MKSTTRTPIAKPPLLLSCGKQFVFTVTARTANCATVRVARHPSSIDAYMAAADDQGDTPCGITVTPAESQ